MAPTDKFEQSTEKTSSLEENLNALQAENAKLKGELLSCQLDNETLQMKLGTEQEEHRELRTALAVRDACDRELELIRHDQKSNVAEFRVRMEALEQENAIFETANTTLIRTLDETREKLGNIDNDDAEELFRELEKLNDVKKTMKNERRVAASLYSEGMIQIMEEMKWKNEKKDLIANFEEKIQKLMTENGSLKKQKEDIVNHAKNSETLFNTRIGILIAEIDRLRNESKNEARESKVVEEMQIKVDTLGSKLNDAMDAIEEIEDENNTLRDRLDDYIEKKMRLEADMKFQKEFHLQEHRVYLEDCQKYETQIGNLNEEMTLLEEARDTLRLEIAEITEKQTQQTITFANEKAKFCHDMERIEEKWNTEVVKLREQNEELEKLVFTSAKETLDKKAFFDDATRGLKERVGELEIALTMTAKGSEREVEALRDEIHVLNTQLEETRSSKDKTIHEYGHECVALEVEVYNLLDKRRTETKRMKTLERKNNWLSKSIKDLAEQRREEIEAMEKEARILTERCEILKKEKVKWLAELRKEVNAWKEETTVKMEMSKKIEELELQKGELEEKITNITEAWRRESTLYQETISDLHEQHTKQCRELENRIRDGQLELVKMTSNHDSDMMREAQEKKQLSDSLDKTRAMMISDKRSMTKKHEDAVEKLSGMLEFMQHNADYDKVKMSEANQLIDSLEYKIASMTTSHKVDCQLLKDEIERLKEEYAKVKENMGVETLDDDEEAEDPDSSDECSCHGCEQIKDLDDDDIYEDMPRLEDERVVKKNKKKTESDEWELVHEDADRL